MAAELEEAVEEAMEEAVLVDEEDRVGLDDLLAAAAHASESPDEHEESTGAVFYSDEEFIAHLKALASEQSDT